MPSTLAAEPHDLFARYLSAVAAHLPEQGAPDILTELGEDLRSRREELEERLGRPATADELAPMLKERGHPWRVAAAFRPLRPLIGAELTPYYQGTMKVLVLWILLPVFLLLILPIELVLGVSPFAVLRHVFVPLGLLVLVAVGGVTVGFAAVEKLGGLQRRLRDWNPLRLRRPPPRRMARSQSVPCLIFLALLFPWWMGWVLPQANAVIDLLPGWRLVHGTFFVPITALWFSGIVFNAILAVSPTWTRGRFLTYLMIDAASTLLFVAVLIAIAPVAFSAHRNFLGAWIFWDFALALVIQAVLLARHGRRLMRWQADAVVF